MEPVSNTPSRTEQVYRAIRKSICECTLEPGVHLIQEELAAKLGVSRQPVQQAMLLLKNDGLVVESGGRGLFVAPIERDSIEHHYQIRIVLDQLAVRLTAERARTNTSFKALLRREGDAIVAAGKGAEQSDSAAEAVRHDVLFHSFIYDMSGNPLIRATAEAHWLFLRRVMIGILVHAKRGQLVWSQHDHILDLMVAGEVEKAVSLATDHVIGAKQALLETMASGANQRQFAVPTTDSRKNA